MNPQDLRQQTREKFWCETHELVNVKNALGYYVCPFCESNLDL